MLDAPSKVRFPDTDAYPPIVVSPVVASTWKVADEVAVAPTTSDYHTSFGYMYPPSGWVQRLPPPPAA